MIIFIVFTRFNRLDQEKKKENLAKMKEKHNIESEDVKTAIMQNNIEFVKKCLDEGEDCIKM